jgi:cytochrome P450
MAMVGIYDPFESATLENPYPVYARLRETTPVFWHTQMNSWVVTRYQDCRDILLDSELFARDRRRVDIEVPEYLQNLQSLDPPAHTPLKKVLFGALRDQDMTDLRQRIRTRVEDLCSALASSGSFDWIHQVAGPISLSATANLFGVPEPPLDFYADLSDKIARRMDSGLLPARAQPGNEARTQLNVLVSRWFATEGGHGLLSAVREAASRVDLPEHYIRNTVGTMFNASYGTLYAMIGNVALTLIEHPEVRDELRTADRRLLDTAVDELIRFEGPAQGTSRVATRQTVIADTDVQAGQVVVTLLASANRDPDEFYRPEELVLDRAPNRHLSFGWGVHGCIGAVFGRIVVQEVIGYLTAAPRLMLSGKPVRRTTATVRSMDLLPVKFSQLQ